VDVDALLGQAANILAATLEWLLMPPHDGDFGDLLVGDHPFPPKILRLSLTSWRVFAKSDLEP